MTPADENERLWSFVAKVAAEEPSLKRIAEHFGRGELVTPGDADACLRILAAIRTAQHS
jgi:hypothetical protein